MTHPKWRTCSRIAATHQLARGVGRKHQQSSLVSASSAISYVDLTAMLYVATRARKGERERVGRRQLSGGLSQVERQEMDISCGDAEGPHPPGRRYFAHLYSLTGYIYLGQVYLQSGGSWSFGAEIISKLAQKNRLMVLGQTNQHNLIMGWMNAELFELRLKYHLRAHYQYQITWSITQLPLKTLFFFSEKRRSCLCLFSCFQLVLLIDKPRALSLFFFF